jgi:hypothetical protein
MHTRTDSLEGVTLVSELNLDVSYYVLKHCRKVAVAILMTVPVTQNAYASTYCTSLNCKDADITRKTVHQLAVAL